MLWLFLALGSALSLSTADALTKKGLSDLPATEMGYARLFYGVPWMIIPFLLTPAPSLPPVFWLWILGVLPFEIAALFLYMKAIKVSPLSLTIPFLAFTPVWMILIAWLLLGELPNVWGGLGVIVVASGAYVLNVDHSRQGILEPVRAIFREQGSWIMLIVSLLYAITATVGKKLIIMAGVWYFAPMYFLGLTALLWPVLRLTGHLNVSRLFSRPIWGLSVGLCNTIMIYTHGLAIIAAPAAYMMAVKRTSLIFAVLYGRIMFNDAGFRQRLTGAALMFAGLCLITIWG